MKKKQITVILALVGASAIAQVADYDTNRVLSIRADCTHRPILTACADNTTFPGYPFLLIPIEPALGLKEIVADKGTSASNGIYDLQGRPVDEAHVEHGIYIINGKKTIRQ